MVSGSTFIVGAYVIYAVVAIFLFTLRPPRQAALIGYFGGWLILPVAIYDPKVVTTAGFTIDVIGTALPSDILLTKALVVPVVTLCGLLLTAPSLFRTLRFGPIDAVMAAFCCTPLLAFLAGRIDLASSVVQAGYLAGVWGGTWMIGRVVLDDESGRRDLVRAMAVSGFALLPVALIEGTGAPELYAHAYGQHPFHSDGVQRYFGTRPLGFFEHGNQYGIWIAMAALAAIHLARQRPRSPLTIMASAILAICAIASQSIGAILLLIVGLFWMVLSMQVRRGVIIALGVLLLMGGATYLSGKAPIERFAYGTAIGQKTMAAFKSVGRGSLTWRVHRDIEALDTIYRAPLAGYGRWDWWRSLNGHPWGLPLLLAGQFGLLSLALLTIALLAGACRELWRGSTALLPVAIILAAIDAWLNSFIYFPALLAAAAIGEPFRLDGRRGPTQRPERNTSSSSPAESYHAD